MRDFRALMESRTGFIPRTQAQALRGYAEGLLNPEYYIYRSVNIHPILEEPWDVQEIDRLLAKNDLDADTAALLMTVFGRMVHSKDKELALFAAESINALERRFLERVQRLRRSLGDVPEAGTARAIVAVYRDLARLFSSLPVLGSFYLDEARRYFIENRRLLVDPDIDIAAYVEILLDKRLFGRADRILAASLARWPDNAKLRFIAAKLAYLRKRPREVVRQLELLKPPDPGAPGDPYAEAQTFWTGGSCRE